MCETFTESMMLSMKNSLFISATAVAISRTICSAMRTVSSSVSVRSSSKYDLFNKEKWTSWERLRALISTYLSCFSFHQAPAKSLNICFKSAQLLCISRMNILTHEQLDMDCIRVNSSIQNSLQIGQTGGGCLSFYKQYHMNFSIAQHYCNFIQFNEKSLYSNILKKLIFSSLHLRQQY